MILNRLTGRPVMYLTGAYFHGSARAQGRAASAAHKTNLPLQYTKLTAALARFRIGNTKQMTDLAQLASLTPNRYEKVSAEKIRGVKK